MTPSIESAERQTAGEFLRAANQAEADGEHLATLAAQSYSRHFADPIAAAERDALGGLLAIAERLAAWDKKWPKYTDHSGLSEREMDAICNDARALLARVTKA